MEDFKLGMDLACTYIMTELLGCTILIFSQRGYGMGWDVLHFPSFMTVVVCLHALGGIRAAKCSLVARV
jgi:hypothetical protein